MWHTVLREQLHEEVWSAPLTQLCEKYGLSDHRLRKVCKRLNAPIPWRGYRAKVEAGHAVPRPTLPEAARQEPERQRRVALLDEAAAWRRAGGNSGCLSRAPGVAS